MSLRRNRRAKIVATLGPASSDPRLPSAACSMPAWTCSAELQPQRRGSRGPMAILREIEVETGRPIGVMADLQGPSCAWALRAGAGAMQPGQRFRLDLDPRPATPSASVCPEIFAALVPGAELLLDDGRLRLRVDAPARQRGYPVLVGGRLSTRASTCRAWCCRSPRSRPGPARPGHGAGAGRRLDRAVLRAAARDIIEARERIGDRARIIAKLESPRRSSGWTRSSPRPMR